MAERKAVCSDGKYRDIKEGDTTIIAHKGAGQISKIGTPSAYYEGDPAQCKKFSRFQSTSIGEFTEQMLIQLRIQV